MFNLEEMFLTQHNEHYYTFACTGLKLPTKEFSSRQLANEYMHKVCGKYGLQIKKVYDDKHDKTYICSDNVRFYIQRV